MIIIPLFVLGFEIYIYSLNIKLNKNLQLLKADQFHDSPP